MFFFPITQWRLTVSKLQNKRDAKKGERNRAITLRCHLLSETCKRIFTRHQQCADMYQACARSCGGDGSPIQTGGGYLKPRHKKTQLRFIVENLIKAVWKWPAHWKELLWKEVRSWWPNSSVSIFVYGTCVFTAGRVERCRHAQLNMLQALCGVSFKTLLNVTQETAWKNNDGQRSIFIWAQKPTVVTLFLSKIEVFR